MPRSDVFNMDCMDYMRSLPDRAFSLAVVDPPYGLGCATWGMGRTADSRSAARQVYMEKVRKNRYHGAGKLAGRAMNATAGKFENWDKMPPPEYFSELFRVSENQIIWGGNYFDLPPCRCVICWDKCQPWENFSQIELAWTSFDMPAKLFRFDNRRGGRKIHATQKPVELYTWLYRTFAHEGDTILDTHLGSGSSRIAAWDAGLDFTGCEIDTDYFNAMDERFERECKGVERTGGHEVTQLHLFSPSIE